MLYAGASLSPFNFLDREIERQDKNETKGKDRLSIKAERKDIRGDTASR
jgi:hypothetical protein